MGEVEVENRLRELEKEKEVIHVSQPEVYF